MLITEYLVGRDDDGKPMCLVVKDVLMTDCSPGAAALVVKATRRDLVQAFIQDDGGLEFISFPDLPADVAELLSSGRSLSIVDAVDNMTIDCVLETNTPAQKVYAK
ncbi:hypothetical protein LCGC14_0327900 [marine sediment metagenome]|uniref:Uncharacterized protein n=1 Tax=marine sediment metagenome TaxID=412755 RepID=A0A0F9W4I9_9ZZZZ